MWCDWYINKWCNRQLHHITVKWHFLYFVVKIDWMFWKSVRSFFATGLLHNTTLLWMCAVTVSHEKMYVFYMSVIHTRCNLSGFRMIASNFHSLMLITSIWAKIKTPKIYTQIDEMKCVRDITDSLTHQHKHCQWQMSNGQMT